jgi:putative membrane protein
MTIRFSILAGVAGLLIAGAAGPASATVQQPVVATDSAFLQTVASLALLQEKLGEMAQKKASSASVKEFARRMTADYGSANKELAEAAKAAALPRPVLLRQHQQALDRFRRMGRGSFDRNYMAEVLQYQDEELRLYQQETEGGKIASLKQLAARRLPATQQHLALAHETARSVGADVTASADQERTGT